MASLIPAIGTCLARMTSGEKRLARRLEEKLEADYLVGYDVPVGRGNVHPDFIVFNPRRGLLSSPGATVSCSPASRASSLTSPTSAK